ncbi:hypothetical protein CkaCkLH20_09856 [Colletotrichum karsti]|uniref:Uncharacterized protein n=1 Tax=Colletotrichum karsti TaxID=1095194 RepID=A0A9P6HYW8_9PEZI|nr:uncharacterized protein CkaCkLH20_09856 [Colletotrichum karsti]KAF9872677.1 hypothetical protein CkaCkLH20_09856 [Colletotrichum karsti]
MDDRQDHDYDDKDHLARDPPFGRASRRFGSPYPHTITSSPSQDSNVHHSTPSSPPQVMVERSVNIQTQPHLAPSPGKNSPRPSGPIKRPSIRWDKQLPVPDRKRTASVGFNAPPTASASDASVHTNDQLHEAFQPVQISEDKMDSTGSSRQPTAFGRPSAPMTRPYRQNDEVENIADDDLQSERGSSWEVSVNGDGASDDECEPIRVKNNDNSLFLPPSPCIAEWFDSIRNEAILSFSVDISKVPDDSEVNPETGKIKDKEPYPASYVDFEEEQSMNKILRHHRLHKTSNWLIFRELESREREKERRKQRRKEQERSRAKVDNSRQRALVRTTNKQPTTVFKDGPLSDCVLRPALLSDARGCADIYNLAVETNATVPGTNSVSIHKFESFLNDCKREKLPSVVAAVQRADLTDVRNWPSTDAYRQYMKWRQTQPKGDESFDTKIYGFAFLEPYEKGPAFGTGAATETVKAVVFVHPEHRRNGIGSALLHRLLTQTSFMYHGDVRYEWIDPAAVEDSFYVPYFRPIHRIVLHGMVGGEGTELQWMDKFMKSFQFDKAGHLNQIYKVTKPHGIDWYDQVIWVHWANKINTGQTFYAGDESECSYDYPGKAQSPVLPPQKLLEYPNGPDCESDGAYSY